MLTNLIAGTIGALMLTQPADTTISAQGVSKLRIENHEGTIIVRTWDRNEIQVMADDSEDGRVEISRSGDGIKIRPGTPPGEEDVDMEITMPATLSLEIQGPFSDVDVQGSRGVVAVSVVEGDVTILGGTTVAVHVVEGDVTIEGASGTVAVHSSAGDVTLGSIRGTIAVEAIDGDIGMLRIESADVHATSVDGNVTYDGTIRDGGQYRLATHDGELVCTIPEGANVTVAVATYDGDFRASFPISLQGRVDKRFEFTLGSGSARLALEAFDGEIHLIRPGEAIPEDWE
jgi:hypothetical protein